jgi:hypothetical protein
MDSAEVEEVRTEVEALQRALAEERFRHVAGIERRPSVSGAFAAHGVAAHRDTVAALREQGEADLAGRVAALAADRAAAVAEDAWRAAEAAVTAPGPDGPIGMADASLAALHERDPQRRRSLGRAVLEAAGACAAPREAAVEERARARAGLGLPPAWEDVVQADDLLARSDAAWGDVLGWLARREGSDGMPGRDLDRTGLLHLLALRPLDGLFLHGPLLERALGAFDGLGIDIRRVRLDAVPRGAKWPGAHALEGQVSLRREGGVADWAGLLDAAGRGAACVATSPATRDPAFPAALGALAAGLLLEPRYLAEAVGLSRRQASDVIRQLALRALLGLRTSAAALRVATEVERGTSGEAWREAYAEALSRATGARWPGVLAARDGDAAAHRATLAGAAWGARMAEDLRQRLDEDYWRNPRTPEAMAGRLAAGRAGPETERPPLALAAEALVRRLEAA